MFVNDHGRVDDHPEPVRLLARRRSPLRSRCRRPTRSWSRRWRRPTRTRSSCSTPTNPVLTPWVGNVKSVLEMWFSGEEGGTSTARLLLGLADPSGHTDITWPANATDTLWGYNETVAAVPGDTTGPHLERLNGGPNGTTDETEGIYNGYRFFDKEGITPQFPFGYGLSYTLRLLEPGT